MGDDQILHLFAFYALAGCRPIWRQKQISTAVAQTPMRARNRICRADPRIGHAVRPVFVSLVKPAQFELQIWAWPEGEAAGKRQVVRSRGDKFVDIVVKSGLFGSRIAIG